MGNSEWTPGVDMSLSGEASRLRRENEALRKAAQSGAPPLSPEGNITNTTLLDSDGDIGAGQPGAMAWVIVSAIQMLHDGVSAPALTCWLDARLKEERLARARPDDFAPDEMAAPLAWIASVQADARKDLERVVRIAADFCEQMRLQGYAKGPLPAEFDSLEDAIAALAKQGETNRDVLARLIRESGMPDPFTKPPPERFA